MKKGKLGKILRSVRLLGLADKMRYLLHYQRMLSANGQFKREHPGLILPPPYFIYETYRLNYREFFEDGKSTAKELAAHATHYGKINGNWLDWGCGPGRIISHLPACMPEMQIFGCDYNSRYVNWCNQHLTNVKVSENGLLPPLPYQNEFFTIITGLSIFTHLSLESHSQWIDELYRVSKSQGIVMVSFQGSKFRDKLLQDELRLFDEGEIVVRKYDVQGHRLFSAFHPESALRKLIEGKFKVLSIIYEAEEFSQELWILEKI